MSDTLGHARRVGRRAWLKNAALLAGAPATALLPAWTRRAGGAPLTAPAHEEMTIATPPEAVVETAAGKVRGFIRNGIYTYKGIPYAGSTEGAGRFAPPTASSPTPTAVAAPPSSTRRGGSIPTRSRWSSHP